MLYRYIQLSFANLPPILFSKQNRGVYIRIFLKFLQEYLTTNEYHDFYLSIVNYYIQPISHRNNTGGTDFRNYLSLVLGYQIPKFGAGPSIFPSFLAFFLPFFVALNEYIYNPKAEIYFTIYSDSIQSRQSSAATPIERKCSGRKDLSFLSFST